MGTPNMYTVAEVAAVLGITGSAVRQRIALPPDRIAHIHAHKLGRDWFVTPEELARVKAIGPIKPGPQRPR